MDLLLVIVVAVVVQGLVFGGFCAYLAEQKGKDEGTWFLLGLVFGIIGLLALIGYPSEAGSQRSRSTARTSGDQSKVPGSTATLEPGESTRVCPSSGKLSIVKQRSALFASEMCRSQKTAPCEAVTR
jgi:hypothetical protein